MPSFSVVMVNYKTRQMTSTCLKLLKKALAGYNAQIWVVDNYSADESVEYLRALDWIHLIERAPTKEPGFMAHGNALDVALEKIDTDFLFVLHTDTMIYDPQIFEIMMARCLADPKVVGVGCVDQVYRGTLRTLWRITTRFIKHQVRRLKLAIGVSSRPPKPWIELHLKSFCALWNIRVIKQQGLSFCMADRNPGYEMQDRLVAQGYRIEHLSSKKMFRYLDHIQSGTVAESGRYHKGHRRVKAYQAIMESLGTD